ncbi:glycine oxidase ThiO [Metabacillus sp. RGM 3146]|uniref:glycine oxidase ThiO n=1 Tax=Metabacillus sp. RGM 3146 TaxID=3401092 RepID=UPI003B9C3FA1
MIKVYDCIVIGGGAIGGSVAYELSKRDHTVAIVEKGEGGKEASSAAAGLLGVQAEWDEYDPLFELARESRALFPDLSLQLKELTGIDIGYEEKGIYKIAETDEELEKLKKTARWQEETGEETVFLTGDKLRENESSLSKDLAGAVFYPKDGHVMAPALTKAYLHAAAACGADLYEYTKAENILIENQSVKGIQTKSGMIFGQNAVICAGAWSTPLLSEFRDLKTYPVKGEMICLKTDKPLLQAPVFKNGFYIVPKREGRLLIGATVVAHDFSKKVKAKSVKALLEKAQKILPAIENASMESVWAGLRPQSVHGAPYMKKHGKIDGLYACTGHFRNGILLSPAAGRYMADLFEGKESSLSFAEEGVRHAGVY